MSKVHSVGKSGRKGGGVTCGFRGCAGGGADPQDDRRSQQVSASPPTVDCSRTYACQQRVVGTLQFFNAEQCSVSNNQVLYSGYAGVGTCTPSRQCVLLFAVNVGGSS
jgi:hypothetical protein